MALSGCGRDTSNGAGAGVLMATVNTSVVRVLPVVEESGHLIWRCPQGIQDRTVELVQFPCGPKATLQFSVLFNPSTWDA